MGNTTFDKTFKILLFFVDGYIFRLEKILNQFLNFMLSQKHVLKYDILKTSCPYIVSH